MATETATEPAQSTVTVNGTSKEPEIPKLGKAAVVVNEGTEHANVEVQDVPVPEPGPDEVLLRLNCTGLCLSDLHFLSNDWQVPKMSDLGVKCAGHEGAGVVVKLGSNVKTWKVGDRAGVKPIWDVCSNCEYCWDGRENYCQKAIYTGLAATGTYQQYITSPAKYTSRIPDGIPDEVAAPIMCSASTMHRALTESGLRPGEFVVFPGGGGGVGIQGVQLAKAMGMRPIVIDTGIEKKALAWKMGAESFVDFKRSEDVAEDVKKASDGIGAHGIVVTAVQAYKDAISYLGTRSCAKLVCVGLPRFGTMMVGADPNVITFRGLKIIGSLVGTMRDTEQALQYAKRGLLRPICEVRGLSRFAESVEQLRRGDVAGRIVIDFNKE